MPKRLRSAPRPLDHGRAERRFRGHGAAAVAHARAREQRPPRARGPAVARARRHAALGRGPDGDRALLPPRPQAARGQRQPDHVADGQVGHGRWSPSARRTPRDDRGPRHAPGHADGDPARGQAGAGRRRRAARRPGRARPRRAPAPAAPGGQGLRRRAARPLRPAHRARRARLPQGHRHVAHDRRRHRSVQGACWPARAPSTVRHPDHGKHVEADLSRQVIALIQGSKVQRIYPASSGKPSTPTIQGSFRVYSKTPGLRTPRGCTTRTTSSAASPSTATPRCRSSPPATAACAIPIPDAISVYRWIKIGDIVDVYP